MTSWVERIARCDYCACTTTCYCSSKSKICASCIRKLYVNVVYPMILEFIKEAKP